MESAHSPTRWVLQSTSFMLEQQRPIVTSATRLISRERLLYLKRMSMRSVPRWSTWLQNVGISTIFQVSFLRHQNLFRTTSYSKSCIPGCKVWIRWSYGASLLMPHRNLASHSSSQFKSCWPQSQHERILTNLMTRKRVKSWTFRLMQSKVPLVLLYFLVISRWLFKPWIRSMNSLNMLLRKL